MAEAKEMEEITDAIHQMAIKATPNRRRSQRVRHLKARKFVKNKQNVKHITKPQTKKKAAITSKPKPKLAKVHNKHKNDVVFPLFTTIKYKSIADIYDIEIPSYLNHWLYNLLTMINKADIKKQVDAYSWMVLLYPSLVLMEESQNTPSTLKKLVSKTLNTLSTFMRSEAIHLAHDLELNNALICTELFTNEPHKIPLSVWQNINRWMESCNTFNKFLKISCARAKDIKLVQELLDCSATQLDKKALYSKIRSKWESFIGVYTQLVRLHRLCHMNENGTYLTKMCKQNIMKLCTVFDMKYCAVLRDLLNALKQKSDTLKLDYSYYRYKTMAMTTHTPTTIPPAFAGCIGYIEGDDIDMNSWKVVINALESDTQHFIETVQNILAKPKKKNASLLSMIHKMPKKETHYLRILDNVCYNSLCSMLMYESYANENESDEEIKTCYTKLFKIRTDLLNIIEQLADNELLFCEQMSGLDADMLQSCFLTYDKEGKKVWSVHLMSGILLNYWIRK